MVRSKLLVEQLGLTRAANSFTYRFWLLAGPPEFTIPAVVPVRVLLVTEVALTAKLRTGKAVVHPVTGVFVPVQGVTKCPSFEEYSILKPQGMMTAGVP